MAKSGKLQHKQIMAMNGTSFYNRPKFSETANKVVNASSWALYEKMNATLYNACSRKKQYFLPD